MRLLTLLTAISIGITSMAPGAMARSHRAASKPVRIAANPLKRVFGDKDKEATDSGNKEEKKSKKKKEKEKSEKSDTSANSEAKKVNSEAPAKSEEPAQAEPPVKTEAPPKPVEKKFQFKSEAKPAPVELPHNPNELDSALLSVLRDVDKSLKESDELGKLDDPAQRAAIRAALQALDASLAKAAINPNRIVENSLKDRYEKRVLAESWDSGDLELPDGSQASLNVLWAKKVNGLLNISLAGNCGCRGDSSADRVGEWVVVINGKSTLDSGFDIQSQANVNFWLGKMTNFSIDATTCGEGAASSKVPILKALTTDSRRKYRGSPLQPIAEAATTAKKSISASELVSASPPLRNPHVVVDLPPATAEVERKQSPASILESAHLPSDTAHVLMPKRAIAGEFITVSVVDANGKPEPFVELNFNDFKGTTNAEGKVVFQVPEDAAPGPTLSVSLSSHSDASPERVNILQPLTRSSASDAPRIDHWDVNRAQGVITIEGHNFDGIAENNHVILDARREATIRFASPVELQARIDDLTPGGHDVIVQRNGIRSEPISLGIAGGPPQTDTIVTKGKKKTQ